MLKIGIIGVGRHVLKNILPSLSEAKDIKIVGAVSNKDHIKQELRQKYQIDLFDTLDDLLQYSGLEALYTAAPNAIHYQHVLKALQQNKHVLVEKSFCCEEHEWQHLVDLAKDRNLLVAEAFMFLYHDQFIKLMQLVEDKIIGNIYSIDSKFGFPHFDADNIRYNKKLGGGALFDCGCYPIVAARKIVSSLPHHITSYLQYESNFEVDLGGAALFYFPNKISAHLEWGMGRAYRNEISIWGENGSIFVERAFSKPKDLETSIKIQFQNGQIELISISPCDHFINMFLSFKKAIYDRDLRHSFFKDLIEHKKMLFSILHTSQFH